MQIDDYAFGRLRANGREYDSDVIVHPDRVQEHWRRKQGHRLDPADIESLLDEPPEVLVIGTGYFGRMRVEQATLDALASRGIRTQVHDTRAAVATFNRLQREYANVVAALHLTC